MDKYKNLSFSHLPVTVVLILHCIVLSFCNDVDPTQSVVDNRCTKIKRTEKLSYLQQSGPCVVSYQARCGWFSLDLCTFYKKEICDKNSNVTHYSYSTVKVCCDGFIEALNGTCISTQSADPEFIKNQQINKTEVVYVNIEDIPTKPPENQSPQKSEQMVNIKEEESKISPGALAGAGCGVLFLIIIVAFTVNGIRKRRKRRPKKKADSENDEAGATMLTTST